MSLRTWLHGLCVAVLFGMLVGCGGGDSSTASTGGSSSSGSSSSSSAGSSSSGGSSSGTNTPIQGIATPSSVSVVTATNAN